MWLSLASVFIWRTSYFEPYSHVPKITTKSLGEMEVSTESAFYAAYDGTVCQNTTFVECYIDFHVF